MNDFAGKHEESLFHDGSGDGCFLLLGRAVKMPYLCYTSSSTTGIKTPLPPHPLFNLLYVDTYFLLLKPRPLSFIALISYTCSYEAVNCLLENI